MYVFSEARESRECARLCTCFQRPEKAGSVLGYVRVFRGQRKQRGSVLGYARGFVVLEAWRLET